MLSDTQIAEELIRRRAEIDRLEAEFAQLVWVGHRRGIGAADGSPSTQAWLRRHTGMRDGEARASIETGEVSELLPKIGVAWRDGSVTTGAVRTIAGARVEGHGLELAALEDLLVVLAQADDQRELRRACAHFRNCARADGTEPREHDGVTISAGYDGRTVLNGDLSAVAPRSWSPRSTRSPTHLRTATRAPRLDAGPTLSSGWRSSLWPTCAAPTRTRARRSPGPLP
jgi:hypothetical protein